MRKDDYKRLVFCPTVVDAFYPTIIYFPLKKFIINYQQLKLLTKVTTSKGFSPSNNFPRVFSQGENSQMRNFPCENFPSLPQPKLSDPYTILTAPFGPYSSLRRLKGPNLTTWKMPLGELHIWEVSTWEILIWEVALGKIPNTLIISMGVCQS